MRRPDPSLWRLSAAGDGVRGAGVRRMRNLLPGSRMLFLPEGREGIHGQ